MDVFGAGTEVVEGGVGGVEEVVGEGEDVRVAGASVEFLIHGEWSVLACINIRGCLIYYTTVIVPSYRLCTQTQHNIQSHDIHMTI